MLGLVHVATLVVMKAVPQAFSVLRK